MKIKITLDNGAMGRVTEKLDSISKELVKEAYAFFKKATPIRTGNARRKTYQQGTQIKAKYPYAKRLDDGYSRQAPNGMVKPTREFMKKKLKQIVRKNK
jgi:hypothetical protein